MTTEIEELLQFIGDSRTDVRQLAVKYLASLSASKDALELFKKNNGEAIRLLMERVGDVEPTIAHDAMSALINISADSDIVRFMDDDTFVYQLVLLIVLPKCILSDLGCMLLNNLTKDASFVKKLIPVTSKEESFKKTEHVDNLLEVFVRGEGRKYNSNAEYHFLAGVFANVSATAAGAEYMNGNSTVDGTPRLLRIALFFDHPNVMRRGGCISTAKNCCFVQESHHFLLTSEELNLLVRVLLPLAGPEEIPLEDSDGMPEELQFLEPSKTREKDDRIRQLLVETLLLLTSTRFGRDLMRQKKVYPLLKHLHLAEKVEGIIQLIEEVVNMIARDEEEEEVTPESKRLKMDEEEEEILIEELV